MKKKTTKDGRYHNMALKGYRYGFGSELVPGEKFIYECKLKDEEGWHIGYGPGTSVHTMQADYRDEQGRLVTGSQRVYIQN